MSFVLITHRMVAVEVNFDASVERCTYIDFSIETFVSVKLSFFLHMS
jgi:hypothetical protein